MILYAITHINKDGMRTLTFGNQGRNHFNTREGAQDSLELNKPQLRAKILGKMADTLEVRPVDCYDNRDAKGIFFDLDTDYKTKTEGQS